jgi:hypothetical protein
MLHRPTASLAIVFASARRGHLALVCAVQGSFFTLAFHLLLLTRYF